MRLAFTAEVDVDEPAIRLLALFVEYFVLSYFTEVEKSICK